MTSRKRRRYLKKVVPKLYSEMGRPPQTLVGATFATAGLTRPNMSVLEMDKGAPRGLGRRGRRRGSLLERQGGGTLAPRTLGRRGSRGGDRGRGGGGGAPRALSSRGRSSRALALGARRGRGGGGGGGVGLPERELGSMCESLDHLNAVFVGCLLQEDAGPGVIRGRTHPAGEGGRCVCVCKGEGGGGHPLVEAIFVRRLIVGRCGEVYTRPPPPGAPLTAAAQPACCRPSLRAAVPRRAPGPPPPPWRWMRVRVRVAAPPRPPRPRLRLRPPRPRPRRRCPP